MKRILLLLLLFPILSWAQPLSGSYTIDSSQPTAGTNFQSLTDFATSINANGVSGNVDAAIVPGSGPYNEQVTFNSIPGTGPAAVITLEGNGETVTTLTNSVDRHILRLKDCQYFTINNVRVLRDSSAASGFYGIHILNSGNHITISNCVTNLAGTTSTLTGSIIASGSETSILDPGDFHNINFIGNSIKDGAFGISVYGLLANLATEIVIDSNVIIDANDNGIYLRETNGTIVRHNFFDKKSSFGSTTNFIQVAQANNINAEIYGNTFTVSSTSNSTFGIRGVYLFNGTGHRVYNNVFRNIHLLSGNFTAIEVRTSGTAPVIAFNTISMDTTAASTGNLYGIKEELSNTNTILRNNIVSITQPAADKACIVLGATSSISGAYDSDYNDLFVANGGHIAKLNSASPTYLTALAAWQLASGQDANSHSEDPQFLSLSQCIPTNNAIDNTGIAYGGINDDFDGNPRSPSPDPGAYEFGMVSINEVGTNGRMLTYPNPAKDILNIILPGRVVSSDWIVSDLRGRTVLSGRSTGSSFLIDLNDLSAGAYLLEIGNYRSKFIRQ